jgi:outer membrane protein TolC
MRRLLLATAVGLGVAATATAAELDLAASLRGSVTESPTLSADAERQLADRARLWAMRDAFMPTVVVLHERILDSRIDYSPSIPRITPDDTARHEPHLTALQATLPIFDGFRRWNGLQAAMKKLDAGRHLSVEARQQVLLEAIDAYLSVIRDRGIVAARRQQIAAVSSVAARTEAAFSTQDATLSDVATARSRVEAARAAHDRAQAALQASEIEFARVVGAKPTAGMPAPPAPDIFLPRDVEALRRDFVDQSPRLAAARADVEASKYTAHAAMAELAPRVDLQFTRALQSNVTEAYDKTSDTTLKLVARIPLYTPGTLPGIAQARAASRQASWDAIDSERRSLAKVEAQWVERKGALSAMTRARKRLATMREAVSARLAEQQAGYGTVMGRLDAEAETAEAAIALLTLSYEADMAGWRIAAALARISEDLPTMKLSRR